MSEEDKSQKTEEPTEKKLADARKKGDVPISKEVGIMTSIVALTLICFYILPNIAGQIMFDLGYFLSNPSAFFISSGETGVHDLGEIIIDFVWSLFFSLGIIFLALIIGGIMSIVLQGQFVVALERLKPKLSNISPLSGFKRIYSVSAFIEFVKSIIKVFIVGYMGYVTVKSVISSIPYTYDIEANSIPLIIVDNVTKLLLLISIFVVVIVIFDLIWKRYEWRKKLRMSFRELKEEFKQSEGDPHLKAKLAEKRRQVSRNRMMQSVPTASVIITNPTHYAVALKYESGVDDAPVCVAKGLDEIALKIREIGKDSKVPIMESPPLARALHAQTNIDETIPFEHWEAVAEIISYVMSLDKHGNTKRKAPSGARLSDK